VFHARSRKRKPLALSFPRCFRCFSRKLSAAGSSFAAEILGFRWLRQSEKQRKPSLFSLFPAVHVDKRID